MNALKTAILAALLFAAFSAQASIDIKSRVFKDGDNAVFTGDSITNMGYYGKFVNCYYATRFPEINVSFINKGIGGNQASDLLNRMDTDIRDVRADVYTVMVGMNDVGRKNFTKEERAKDAARCDAEIARRENVYRENMSTLADILAKNSRTVIFFTPSIFDQTAEAKSDPCVGLNDKLGDYGKICAEIAKKYPSAKVVDMWGFMTKVNADYQSAEGKSKSIIGSDRVHPFDLGGFVMAAAFIEQLGEPADVSRLEIKANSFKAFNGEVSNFKRAGGKIGFSYLEHALPMCVPPQLKMGAQLVSFNEKLNREILTVSDLKSGKYLLKIDGKPVGAFSSEEFAKGVNLATLHTPQAKQAERVLAACENLRNEEGKLRCIAAIEASKKKEFEGKSDAQKIEIMKSIAEKKQGAEHFISVAKRYLIHKPNQAAILDNAAKIRAEIRAAAKPSAHNFEIEPVK